MRITVTQLDASDNALTLRYEIRNDSDDDIWICEDIAVFQHDYGFEAYLAEDNQTLLIRRRLDVKAVSSMPYAPPSGRYVRLPAGKTRTESLLLALPIYPRRLFYDGGSRSGPVDAKNLAIEIGYYAGNMPDMIFSMLEQVENVRGKRLSSRPAYPRNLRAWFGGLWHFNDRSEFFRDRNEEIVIPWTNMAFKGEFVSRIMVDGQLIPYEGKYKWPRVSPPDLTRCTRVEIQFQPSMLEYFFPYPGERGLLSPAEANRLKSQQTLVADDREGLKSLAKRISEGGFYSRGDIVTERSTADVTCYYGDKLTASFTVCDDVSIVTKDKHVFRYKMGLPELKVLAPQIKPFKLRARCASNLRDLWHRLRLDHRAKARSARSGGNIDATYVPPTEWCDAMVWAYQIALGNDMHKYLMRPFNCPSMDEGDCHYAMNPNWELNSAPDTVLLFETKSGWNQHGGPELFTLDNHDPKGGCVLLNDGTVKFIRTEQELQQLRWK
jgi:hypothetical protein